jgi:acetyl-CoA carboxylase biotin carboxyl carrier protein
MSDQEATSTQSSGDERTSQQKTNQPERGHRDRDRGRRRHPQQSQPQQQQQRRPEASLNMEELRELFELIAQHGFTDFELEREGIRVRVRRELAPQLSDSSSAPPTTTPAPAPAAPPVRPSAETQSSTPAVAPVAQPSAEPAKAAATTDDDLHKITSPIVGTFYRAASPQAESFVRIGSHVGPDTVVCIIEAMKLMNEIQAETTGEVVKIYVENGQPVEYGQPLFGIKK